MSTVVIGIDPHKASHTAVAVDEHEHPLSLNPWTDPAL